MSSTARIPPASLSDGFAELLDDFNDLCLRKDVPFFDSSGLHTQSPALRPGQELPPGGPFSLPDVRLLPDVQLNRKWRRTASWTSPAERARNEAIIIDYQVGDRRTALFAVYRCGSYDDKS